MFIMVAREAHFLAGPYSFRFCFYQVKCDDKKHTATKTQQIDYFFTNRCLS
jgi:hypothetical protein